MTEPATVLDGLQPHDVKSLDADGRERLAETIRERICQVVSQNGGHFGSNMGVVELTIALHTVFDSPRDRIVWDVSHQCYPHKLLTGRNAEFETLRSYEGISGFCHKGESEHDTAFAGHAGTATSIAAGIARGFTHRGEERHAIAVVGDASLPSGMTLEALNHSGWVEDPNLLVILNDNGMSISFPVGGLHRSLERVRPWVSIPELRAAQGDEEAVAAAKEEARPASREEVETFFRQLGLRYVGPIDGHDTEGLIEALNEIKRRPGPTFLHVLTRKGHGWDPAYDDPVGWHAAKGFLGPQPAQPKPKPRNWTAAFSQALIDLAGEDERVVGITAAMPGGTGLDKFAKAFPERCYDVGICEQHGAGFSSGLRYGGMRPVFAVYSTFLQRAYDQVIHDVALQGNPVVFGMDRGGLVGADGVTHQGLFDLAYLRCIPDVVLLAPMDEPELRAMLRWAVASDRVVGIRWPRDDVPEPIAPEPTPIELGQGDIVAVGEGDVAVFAYGAMVEIALAAREVLAEEGISVTVANARFAKPVDLHMLEALLESHEVVLTAEDHAQAGGFGSACLEAVIGLDPRLAARLRIAGVPDAFVHHGARELQLRDAGLDAAGLADRLRRALAATPTAPAVPVLRGVPLRMVGG